MHKLIEAAVNDSICTKIDIRLGHPHRYYNITFVVYAKTKFLIPQGILASACIIELLIWKYVHFHTLGVFAALSANAFKKEPGRLTIVDFR